MGGNVKQGSIRKERHMHETVKDPVCGMDVTYESAQARSQYRGQTYYFCSLGCKEIFDREPEKYVTQEHIH
jgi:YHS domain-containing protein